MLLSLAPSRPALRGRPTGPPARLRDDLPGRLVLAAAAVLTVLSAIRALLPMWWLGDGEIWRASDTATIARNFYRGGMDLFLPQINWGGNGPGYVETELPILPWLSALVYHVTGEDAAVGRLIAVAFGVLAAAAFWALVRRILPAAPARWALLAFVASPALMRWGNAFMPDVVVLAFTVLTLLAFQRWLEVDRGVWLAATAAATAAAGLAKSSALHVGLVLVVWLLIADRRRFRRPSLYLAAVAALVPVGLWLWHASELYRTYGNTFGVISGGDSKFGSWAIWTSPAFWTGNASIEAVNVFGLLGLPVALVGAVVAWRWRGPVLLAAGIPAVALFYLVAARYSMGLGPQYHVFSVPYAAILEGLGAAALLGWLSGRARSGWVRRVGVVGLVAALSAVSLTAFALSFQDRSGVLAVCSRGLDAVSRPAGPGRRGDHDPGRRPGRGEQLRGAGRVLPGRPQGLEPARGPARPGPARRVRRRRGALVRRARPLPGHAGRPLGCLAERPRPPGAVRRRGRL